MMKFRHNLKILLTKEEIQARITKLADELNTKYKDKELTLIVIMNGGVFFYADLLKQLDMRIRVDAICAASYVGQQSTRQITFYKKVNKPIITDHDVVVIEDIIDTGLTLNAIYEELLALKPKSLSLITLLDKDGTHPDFKYPYQALFEVPNKFIVGYGLEFDDNYRQLDQIYTVED
ncbi:hypoxanthine-guanine phosphoribosyltransferase [Williamsoniiplasma luminosum]|uniref:Hypoxanthine-guanine phosphoribosyltransferase n=1 Tax=Williamsoniiplasma luminosum TaxID=214888 RepID=A0A2K8NUB4_9MOLU|nr:phosphoribosyltransferase family protein [Williamsoniiplasma luminosum]ATZ17432.1 hypoxanthine-guanine phosphoribosyltransferase [Williamsoniiplasma luminosum]